MSASDPRAATEGISSGARLTRPSALAAAPAELPPSIGRYTVEGLLGEGGFGLVYLARDEQLDRLVAIKVPHPKRIAAPYDAEAYLREARLVAGLDHPNIVPVFDVGGTDEIPCFAVSKYIDGATLSELMCKRRYSPIEAAELIATLADALHYAHQKGLVHRDIKPGNILLNRQGTPFIADFGLALRDEDFESGHTCVGTPAYMSPEQARGEAHRVDGRSDIFSLGVVFYELLGRRRPFRAENIRNLREQIVTLDPKPPRQLSEDIPKELERICLRALAKRATDRFSTARDMADDLRAFLLRVPQAAHRSARLDLPGSVAPVPDEDLMAKGAATPTPFSQPMRIVPKGLRSFDSHDADFFLDLLPGPRDRNGLPDIIRFWKNRIEETDGDDLFTVGLIYGPSGCGKSSLVKAGLLPRLSEHVVAIDVEAAPGGTEERLLNALQRRFPILATCGSLTSAIAAVRRGQCVSSGQKLLLVVDQFEQWLHAENTAGDLAAALRQCDGAHVQCLVLVRDDFYMAVNRFFQELEVPIAEGRNYSLVDLFDLEHASKVLAAFGRAYGKLAFDGRLTPSQQAFLHKAVAGLAENGKVISVRLALFAEMLKGRPWSPETLRDVGGTRGIGVTFLEETFSAQTAPPSHRVHEPAARAVLQVLLPQSGADIKGQMQHYQQLLAISGYAGRPEAFRALLDVLVKDVRLIAPTEPAGGEASTGGADSSLSARYYQLTHDFLVPALREWLTRKQSETRRGRAQLRLDERAAMWTHKTERKQLPSFAEWLNIKLLTRSRQWSQSQQRMMRTAAKLYLRRSAILLCLIAVVVCSGLVAYHHNKNLARLTAAKNLVQQLWSVDFEYLPSLLDDLDACYPLWKGPVTEVADDDDRSPAQRLRAHLALARHDDGRRLGYLTGGVLTADAPEHAVVRRELERWRDRVAPSLWQKALDARTPPEHLIRAVAALAQFDAHSGHWPSVSERVTRALVSDDPLRVGPWIEALKPVCEQLTAPLLRICIDAKATDSQRLMAASIVAQYVTSHAGYLTLEQLVDLVLHADAAQYQIVFPLVAERRAELGTRFDEMLRAPVPLAPGSEPQIECQANAAEALLRLGEAEKFWPLLQQGSDPRLRTELIEHIQPALPDWRDLLGQVATQSEPTVRQAILLGLDRYHDHVAKEDHRQIADRLLSLYEVDRDAAIHSAAEWLLVKWGFGKEAQAVKARLAGKPREGANWFVNSQLHTMLIVDPPGTFSAGDPHEGTWHEATIDYVFAVGAQEVTIEQFQRFEDAQGTQRHRHDEGASPEQSCPVNFVSWYAAAKYCRWLSEQEGIAEEDECYPAGSEIGAAMAIDSDRLRRVGYRLPTEDEWEWAARAGSQAEYCFGSSHVRLSEYAWYASTSQERTWPVGNLKPNSLGLFDIHGNVSEWCGAVHLSGAPPVQRGGHCRGTPKFVRSTARSNYAPEDNFSMLGFRLVKVIRKQ